MVETQVLLQILLIKVSPRSKQIFKNRNLMKALKKNRPQQS